MAYQLKCKAIALATEAQAFKKQEQREKRLMEKWRARAAAARAKSGALGADPWKSYSVAQRGIHLHRVKDIRKEARNALLAYGFVRGMPYRRIENFSWTQPNWDRVEKLAIRYSGESEQDTKQKFAQWLFEARGNVKPKWSETLVPGTVKTDAYDPDWVQFQADRDLKEWEDSQPITEAELLKGLEPLVVNHESLPRATGEDAKGFFRRWAEALVS